MARQCLGNKRISLIDDLIGILASWEMDRNTQQKGVNWRFSAEDARVKLKRLYPTPFLKINEIHLQTYVHFNAVLDLTEYYSLLYNKVIRLKEVPSMQSPHSNNFLSNRN